MHNQLCVSVSRPCVTEMIAISTTSHILSGLSGDSPYAIVDCVSNPYWMVFVKASKSADLEEGCLREPDQSNLIHYYAITDIHITTGIRSRFNKTDESNVHDYNFLNIRILNFKYQRPSLSYTIENTNLATSVKQP